MRRVYLDHAATTPLDSRVLEAMMPYLTEKFGNASSLHSYGREAREALEGSRVKLAGLIGAGDDEIVFTSGGTESDNLAIKGAALANRKKGRHIITSAIEHHAVLHTCEYLEKNGFKVTYLPVNQDGILDAGEVERAITDKTILITVMHANNEIGTIQPIREIAEIAGEHGVCFHTDAVQTMGKIPVNVEELGVDLLSISGHKFYGPKGVGALYIRRGTKLEVQMHGGGHERGRRSSTENIPGIVGMARAAELAVETMEEEAARETRMRDRLIQGLLEIDETYLNGHPTLRVPNNVNVRFSYIEGESLVLGLDMKGIAASTGSACSSTSLEPSHVLLALGLKPEEAHGSLRLTLGRINTEEDIDYVLETIPQIVERLRAMSPLGR